METGTARVWVRSTRLGAAIALVFLAGCGSSVTKLDEASNSRSETTTAAAAKQATCGSADEGFAVDVVTGPAPDQASVFADAPGAALRAFLDAGGDPGGGGFKWTGGDWLVLRRDETLVQYGYRKTDWFAYANAELKPAGWDVSNYGTCQPRVVGSSGWSVHRPVDNEASYVTITYGELVGCGGEVVPTKADTTVTETDSEVGILLRLTPAEPTTAPTTQQGCGAMGVSSSARKRVELRSPLGGRALVDYGAIPHTRVS